VSTDDQWPHLLSGEYSGWARQVGPGDHQWEDLIGNIQISCVRSPDGQLNVNIRFIEWGTWTGRFDPGTRSLSGDTGQPGSRFRCHYKDGEPSGMRCRLDGEILETGTDAALFKFQLKRDYR
jgi:hypothetical protein